MGEQPKPQQDKPPKAPAPGTLPKLPQDIFNLEKKGGDVGGEKRGS